MLYLKCGLFLRRVSPLITLVQVPSLRYRLARFEALKRVYAQQETRARQLTVAQDAYIEAIEESGPECTEEQWPAAALTNTRVLLSHSHDEHRHSPRKVRSIAGVADIITKLGSRNSRHIKDRTNKRSSFRKQRNATRARARGGPKRA